MSEAFFAVASLDLGQYTEPPQPGLWGLLAVLLRHCNSSLGGACLSKNERFFCQCSPLSAVLFLMYRRFVLVHSPGILRGFRRENKANRCSGRRVWIVLGDPKSTTGPRRQESRSYKTSSPKKRPRLLEARAGTVRQP